MFALFAACYGWGRGAAVALGADDLEWPFAAGLGIAVAIAIGGVASLAGVATRTMLGAWTAIGAAAAVVALARSRRARRAATPSADPLTVAAALGAGALVAIRVLASLANRGSGPAGLLRFNGGDDFGAYFVHARRLVDTGTLVGDAFNYRGVVSGLGGKAVLDGLTLVALDPRSLNAFDAGLCVAILAAMVVALARRVGTTPRMAFACVIALLLIPPISSNSTSFYTGAVLVLLLYRLWAFPLAAADERRWARPVLSALSLAALSALKSTHLPFAVALGAALPVAAWRADGWRRPVADAAAMAAASAALLAPWMIEMRLKAGTLLYPVFGAGIVTTPGVIPERDHAWTAWGLATGFLRDYHCFPYIAAVTIAATIGIEWLRTRDVPRVRFIAFTVAAATAGVAGVVYTTRGAWQDRYTQAPVLALVAIVAVEAMRVSAPAGIRTRRALPLVALLLVAVIPLRQRADVPAYVRWVGSEIRFAASGMPLVAPGVRARYAAAQSAMLPGARAINVVAELPFLFDMTRNSVMSWDMAGSTSPLPHLAAGAPPDSVAAYLSRAGVTYVIYERTDWADRLRPVLVAPVAWTREVSRRAFEVQTAIAALSGSRHRVYDDGSLVVFELRSPPGDDAAR